MASKSPDDSPGRCGWAGRDPLYLAYHDQEWGVPLHDDRKLFEMLILEGAQAGLSWLTVLRRRQGYRLAYDGFDPGKMARWSDARIQELLGNPAIIRNRLKIEAARSNARLYLDLVAEQGSFTRFIWSFVDGQPVTNHWREMGQIPVSTPAAERLSRELKRRGGRFVGPTICYAFMQAVGMVNDHLTGCYRHSQLAGP